MRSDTRAATIVAKTSCDLLSLSKKNFDAIFSAALADDNAKISYFESMLSNEMDKQQITSFIRMFEEKKLSRGYFLFREGEPATHLYFLKEGEIELFKKVNVRAGNGEINKGSVSGTQQMINKLGKNSCFVKNICKNESIGIVSSGQIIGEDDFLSEKGVWTYSAKIIYHQTQLYQIGKYNFQLSHNILEKFLEFLRKIGDQKNKWRNSQLDMKNENTSNLERFIGKDYSSKDHDHILKKLGLSYLPKISHNPVYIRNMNKETSDEELGPINIFSDIRPIEPRFKVIEPEKKIIPDSGSSQPKQKLFANSITYEKSSMLSRLCKNKSGKSMSLRNTFQSFYKESKNKQSLNDLKKNYEIPMMINGINFTEDGEKIFQSHMQDEITDLSRTKDYEKAVPMLSQEYHKIDYFNKNNNANINSNSIKNFTTVKKNSAKIKHLRKIATSDNFNKVIGFHGMSSPNSAKVKQRYNSNDEYYFENAEKKSLETTERCTGDRFIIKSRDRASMKERYRGDMDNVGSKENTMHILKSMNY